MNCAKCLDSQLNAERHADVEIHRCPTCSGLFLNDGVLETLAGIAGTEALDQGGFTAISDRHDMQPGRCPRCTVVMAPFLGPRNMRIDRCPQCSATFLDQGELAAIIAPGKG